MTILHESTQRIITDTGCIFLIFFIAAIMLTAYAFSRGYVKEAFIYLAITIAVVVIVAICFTKPHRKIKAIIPEDYSAVELLDKYTINGNEGEIWTLTEKEPMKKQEDGKS